MESLRRRPQQYLQVPSQAQGMYVGLRALGGLGASFGGVLGFGGLGRGRGVACFRDFEASGLGLGVYTSPQRLVIISFRGSGFRVLVGGMV